MSKDNKQNNNTEVKPAVENTTPVDNNNTAAKSVMTQISELQAASKPVAQAVKKEQVIDAKYLANVPSNAFPVISDLPKLVEDINKNGTSAQKALVASLTKYIDVMAPGKNIDSKEGAVRQFSLWRTIKRILEDDPREEFKGLWTILLAFVKDNLNGCFSHTHCYRFTEKWTKSQNDFIGLNNILNLLLVAASLGGRKNINREVHLTHALSTGFNDEASLRIFSYYKNV